MRLPVDGTGEEILKWALFVRDSEYFFNMKMQDSSVSSGKIGVAHLVRALLDGKQTATKIPLFVTPRSALESFGNWVGIRDRGKEIDPTKLDSNLVLRNARYRECQDCLAAIGIILRPAIASDRKLCGQPASYKGPNHSFSGNHYIPAALEIRVEFSLGWLECALLVAHA